MLSETALIHATKSYYFGSEQVQNYSIFANNSAMIFVSDIAASYIACYTVYITYNTLIILQKEEPHIFLVNTSPRMATHVLCTVSDVTIEQSGKCKV